MQLPKRIADSGGPMTTQKKYNNTNTMIQCAAFSWTFVHFCYPQIECTKQKNGAIKKVRAGKQQPPKHTNI
jgi:hypothetical protein